MVNSINRVAEVRISSLNSWQLTYWHWRKKWYLTHITHTIAAISILKIQIQLNKGLSFLPNRGAWKSWGSQNFSWEIGGSQKNQEIFGWLQISMKILFNEIAPKMHIFCATRIGDYMFLQHCTSSGVGVIKIFDHQIGGSQKYCQGAFGNSWPPIPKKMVAP